ncbi:hypothetical protein AL755_02630 (plasmid) [Arthrobacter sp. ERGS1:01]|uniref:DUF2516 family protein n=1 Tax=Arthrobacter sp. ERGS1:01 TaxID=1704044 RepID=UPI0006B47D2F|nr:DUF2516 family protein [Arthrobacter sp. ERGS1:01]ALE04571.1 hypothetical protein AL755_02630 [Arthrobacter sp. ERGS1:01]
MIFFVNVVSFVILTALGALAFGIQLWALSDCLRTPGPDFQRVDKRTKQFWGALTGVSAFLGFVYILGPVTSLTVPGIGLGMIFNLVAVTVAGVYLADVRPALVEVRGRGKGNQRRGSSSW